MRLGAVPELHVDLDLAVDLNDDATERASRRDHAYGRAERVCVMTVVAAEGRTDAEQDVPVIVQVHDDVQVHLQNGICTQMNTSKQNAHV